MSCEIKNFPNYRRKIFLCVICITICVFCSDHYICHRFPCETREIKDWVLQKTKNINIKPACAVVPTEVNFWNVELGEKFIEIALSILYYQLY